MSVAEHTGTMENFIQPLLQVNNLSLIQCSRSPCSGSNPSCSSGLQFPVASSGSNVWLLLTRSPREGSFPFSLYFCNVGFVSVKGFVPSGFSKIQTHSRLFV